MTWSSPQDRRPMLVSFGLLIAAAVLIAVRPGLDGRTEGPSNDSPDACMARLLAVEAQGNHVAYLECFVPAERSKLEAHWRGKSPSDVAAELRGHQADVVGHAVTGLQLPGEPKHAQLVLERIHKDHTSRQRVSLIRIGNRWQITELATPEREVPEIPYGTPVFTPE